MTEIREKVSKLSATLSSRKRLSVHAMTALATLMMFVSPAAAGNSSGPDDILCNASGNAVDGASSLVEILSSIIGAIMVLAPTVGIVMFLFFYSAASANPEEESEYKENAKKSLFIGIGIPVAAYAFEALSSAIFSFHIGCIIP